jgi:hypothetical protein
VDNYFIQGKWGYEKESAIWSKIWQFSEEEAGMKKLIVSHSRRIKVNFHYSTVNQDWDNTPRGKKVGSNSPLNP